MFREQEMLLEELARWVSLFEPHADTSAAAAKTWTVGHLVDVLYPRYVDTLRTLLSGCSGPNDSSAAAQQLEQLIAWRVRC